jgi:hypothetical protein
MRIVPKAVVLAAILIVASAAFASTRSHAVRPVADGIYAGSVFDVSNRRPVIDAEVTNGTRSVKSDARGSFAIIIPTGRPTEVTIHRSGYDDVVLFVTLPAVPNTGGTIVSPAVPPPPSPAPPTPQPPTPMTPRTPVTVKMTNGQTVSLDADTIKFAYIIPFASPITSESASFCMKDGTAYTPDRSEFARIVGPAAAISNGSCCQLGPVLAVNVEMKTGEKSQVFFSDSCFGYDVILNGRERDTALFLYLNFSNIASVEFP